MITQRTDEVRDVHIVTIDRHDRRNALDSAHCRELEAAITEAASTARSIVLTAAGTAFCAGADLDTVYDGTFREALYSMLAAITDCPIPVVAAVNGAAIGAGTQLVLACDLRIAAPTARFAIPTARNGLAVDPWTIRRLVLMAGGGPARAILLGCDTLTAEQAHTCGLVDRLGDTADAMAWARDVASMAPLTLRYNKRTLQVLCEPANDLTELRRAFDACWDSEDLVEANRARTENRPPVFRGR